MDVTNAGVFTTNDDVTLTVGTEFKQDGAGTNTIGGNITSSNDGITFATAVTLDGTDGETITFQTGEGSGDDILLSSTLASNANEDILFDAGADGNITVTGTTNVGTGDVTVRDAAVTLFTGKVTADNYTQNDGTTSTTFSTAFDI